MWVGAERADVGLATKHKAPLSALISAVNLRTPILTSTMSSQGIQTLLEAEKSAAKIVQEARQYRTQKLKDARSEAAKEIEEYRKQKDEEFKSLESQRAGTTSNAQDAIDQETEGKIAKINEAYAAQRDGVVQKLLDRVVLVKPELHRNLKKVEA